MTSYFRALSSRNFRLYFFGQGVSLIGTWMQQVAMSWLVYRLTDSAFLLGVVGFAAQIPTFFMSPLAGVWADRFNRRRIILLTQLCLMIEALALAVLTLSGLIQVWHIITLSVLFGFINSLDIPTRQSFFVEMVDRRDNLPNAIALNATMVNVTRLIGPPLAGFCIGIWGEGVCFLFNAISFLAVLISLWMMTIPTAPAASSTDQAPGLMNGFRYAFGFPPIRAILILLAVLSLLGTPYSVLMPIFANRILLGGPATLGFLTAASGSGALLGALFMTMRRSVLGMGRLIGVNGVIFGISLLCFAASQDRVLSMIALFFGGFGIMVVMACANTLLQTLTDDDKRGRVMSFYVMMFMGMTPIGSLLAGSLATHIGAPLTVSLGGVCCILGSLIFASRLPSLKKVVRPIYVRMGILPPISE